LAYLGAEQEGGEGAEECVCGGVKEGVWKYAGEEDHGGELEGACVPCRERVGEIEFPEYRFCSL